VRLETPLEALGLPADASPGEVKGRWRELAMKHHPDRGGDPATFDRLRKAYDLAMVMAAKCPTCHGTKKVIITRNFNQLAVRCPGCNGTGTRS
jgi:DnaJ-class molecular chaperone